MSLWRRFEYTNNPRRIQAMCLQLQRLRSTSIQPSDEGNSCGWLLNKTGIFCVKPVRWGSSEAIEIRCSDDLVVLLLALSCRTVLFLLQCCSALVMWEVLFWSPIASLKMLSNLFYWTHLLSNLFYRTHLLFLSCLRNFMFQSILVGRECVADGSESDG